MINYSLLEIRRVIMHRILPKTVARAHVEVESNKAHLQNPVFIPRL